MTIETERLIIRRFQNTDWYDLHAYLSQPAVVEFEPYDAFNLEASKIEAERRTKDERFWAVCLKSSTKLIGNIYLAPQDFNTWELGFVFNLDYQKQGYATEAATALIDFIFREQKAHRIIAMCNPQNISSWGLLERLGLRREGHFLQNIHFKMTENQEPLWIDSYLYAILANEWLEV